MITKTQAIEADEFHYFRGEGRSCEKWRRNGQTQTWKTRPNDFRVPVKHGLYSYGQLTQAEAVDPLVHVASECPHK